MSESCHGGICKKIGADIALVGNQNTGKSTLFNYLTGLNATVSNFPGTTVDVTEGEAYFEGRKIRIADLPGIYSLSEHADESRVAKEYLMSGQFKAIINIIDSNLLERNLYLTLQLIEEGIPVIVALNFYDELKETSISLEPAKLSVLLGVPVVPINAINGSGVDILVNIAAKYLGGQNIAYKNNFVNEESMIDKLKQEIQKVNDSSKDKKKFGNIQLHEEQIEISRCRHNISEEIASQVVSVKTKKSGFADKLDKFTTGPLTGVFTIVVVLGAIFVSLFYFGDYFSRLLGNIFKNFILNPLAPLISLLPNSFLQTVINWSLDGISAALQVAIPYVGIFYVALALLEDSGYMARLSYVLDKTMHKLHLHGNAVVPMLLGFGCTVPAVLSTRILPSKKERIITSVLISFIPCSARTAVILGAVGAFVGIKYALLIYAMIVCLIFVIGYLLGKCIQGESIGLIMEMPKYRMPTIKNVFKKTWFRVKDFIYMAFPLIVIGSASLGVLKYFGFIEILVKPFQPIIVDWLMLPPEVGITLVYGFLRKELALELVYVISGRSIELLMTKLQMFIFALVITLYVPCIATFAALRREFGLGQSLLISVFTIIVAVVVAGLAGKLFLFFGILA